MVEDISELSGLSRTHPIVAFLFATMLFSLAGIPPLAGFFAKWYVFLAAVEADLYPLAIIGVLASVVSAFYYLRIIKVIYIDEPVESFSPMSSDLKSVLGVTGILVIAFVLIIGQLTSLIEVAASSLF